MWTIEVDHLSFLFTFSPLSILSCTQFTLSVHITALQGVPTVCCTGRDLKRLLMTHWCSVISLGVESQQCAPRSKVSSSVYVLLFHDLDWLEGLFLFFVIR